MDIQALFDLALREEVAFGDIKHCASNGGLTIEDALNHVSIELARAFYDGTISYKAADDAMNVIWPIMLNLVVENNKPLVEPCYEIYEAFDAGELGHGEGLDPVEKYTRPLIAKALGHA